MTNHEKKPLSETAFDRKLDAKIREIQHAQAARDAEQDLKFTRPSRAMQAMKAADVTERYPLASWAIGIAFVIGALGWLEGVKLYIGAGVGVCFVPGLAGKVVRLATGLKKAKGSE